MTNVRTILVPIDFSEGSLAAVRHARELGDVFHSHIHLLHVAPGPDAPKWALELFGSQLRPVQEQHRLQALDQLATVIVSLQLDPFRTTGLVRNGCAEQVITEYADEIHADLVVMGLHGDHFIPQVRVGQVVERVLGNVRCPVLAIPEERLPVARLEAPTRLGEPLAC
jgi:nucleotide-binding universal stress UspA family protein